MNRNDVIDPMVYTDRGFLNISEVKPFDWVYEYGTNRKLQVIGNGSTSAHKVADIYFTDGDHITVDANGFVLNGDDEIPIKRAAKLNQFDRIDMAKAETKSIHNYYGIDLYLIGVFLTYGYNSFYEVSLPIDMIQRIQPNMENCGLVFYGPRTEANVQFAFIDHPDVSLTWYQIVPQYIQHGKYAECNFDNQFLTLSIDDRWKMIHGIFDAGAVMDEVTDHISIRWADPISLTRVQRLLRSVGIPSSIIYSPKIGTDHSYMLIVLGNYRLYPGLYDDRKKIHSTIVERFNMRYIDIDPFDFKIQKISIHHPRFPLQAVKVYNLTLEKEHAVYYGEKFLPEVST